METPLYSYAALLPGHRVEGPAVIEADFTTVVVPPGQRFHLDRHGLGILEATDSTTPATSGALTPATGLA